jgi:hypothetical protein
MASGHMSSGFIYTLANLPTSLAFYYEGIPGRCEAQCLWKYIYTRTIQLGAKNIRNDCLTDIPVSLHSLNCATLTLWISHHAGTFFLKKQILRQIQATHLKKHSLTSVLMNLEAAPPNCKSSLLKSACRLIVKHFHVVYCSVFTHHSVHITFYILF